MLAAEGGNPMTETDEELRAKVDAALDAWEKHPMQPLTSVMLAAALYSVRDATPEAMTFPEWGIRDRSTGVAETWGTRPGGDVGNYGEEVCRYIARHNRQRWQLVRRLKTTYRDRYTEWEEVDE